MDHPRDAVKEVLDWLRFIEKEFTEMMPLSAGGDTATTARTAIHAIELLVRAEH